MIVVHTFETESVDGILNDAEILILQSDLAKAGIRTTLAPHPSRVMIIELDPQVINVAQAAFYIGIAVARLSMGIIEQRES